MTTTMQKVADLPYGSMAAFQVEDKSVAIANVGGEFFAFDNTCTHLGCALAAGTLSGVVVTCPCHGSQFDVTTGAVVAGPASVPVATYVARVVEDEVHVSLPSPDLGRDRQEATTEPPAVLPPEAERERMAQVL